MKIGIVGAGRMGQTLAFLALRAGHRVQLSNSTPDAEFHAVLATLGSGASGGSTHDVAHFGELCFIATRWEQVPAAASEWRLHRDRARQRRSRPVRGEVPLETLRQVIELLQ